MAKKASRFRWRGHSPWYFGCAVFVSAAAVGAIAFTNTIFIEEFQAISPRIFAHSKQKAVIVRVSIGAPVGREFEGEAKADLTLGGAIQEIGSISGLKFSLKGDEISGIDALKSEKGKRWNVYVNGRIVIHPLSYAAIGGDRISIRYE